MRPLVLYFDEHSAPSAGQDFDYALWKKLALTLYEVLPPVFTLRKECRVSFGEGIWHGPCGDKLLSTWLSEWLGRDRFQKFSLSVVNHLAHSPDQSEVICAGKVSSGLTMAQRKQSWSISFPQSDSPWSSPQIDALLTEIVGEEVRELPCQISNLSSPPHVDHWRADIERYGYDAANNNQISLLDGYPILMYPGDHLPPHVHLVDPENRARTLAKFRVDKFSRLEGPPKWDRVVDEWVAAHREQIGQCWEFCSRNEHPFMIGD